MTRESATYLRYMITFGFYLVLFFQMDVDRNWSDVNYYFYILMSSCLLLGFMHCGSKFEKSFPKRDAEETS